MFNLKMFSLLAFVVVIAGIGSAALAAPAYPGYTGMIFTPNETTLGMGAVDFGAAFVSNDDVDTSYFSANFGVIDGLEVGASILDPDEGDSNTIINAKYSIVKENYARPGIAVGFSDLANEIDSTPYIVVGKSLNLPGLTVKSLRGHIGFGDGTLDGLFAGLSATLTDTLTLSLEHDSDEINVGLQMSVATGLRAHADLIDGDDLGFGLSYSKGF
ncbi:MAG: hypothetical protein ABFD49_09725 [Armatimonadota bacterium]|nr:hypothetical protein [bacterium]